MEFIKINYKTPLSFWVCEYTWNEICNKYQKAIKKLNLYWNITQNYEIHKFSARTNIINISNSCVTIFYQNILHRNKKILRRFQPTSENLEKSNKFIKFNISNRPNKLELYLNLFIPIWISGVIRLEQYQSMPHAWARNG